jgi:hypothetical protein
LPIARKEDCDVLTYEASLCISVLLVAIAVGSFTAHGGGWAIHKRVSDAAQVVVPKGQRVQIAFVASRDFPDYTYAIRNAVQMAIQRHLRSGGSRFA